MAYVSLSRDLRHEVRSKIHSLKRTELDGIKPAEGAITELHKALDPEIKRREIIRNRPAGLEGYDHLFTKANRLVYRNWEVDVVVFDKIDDREIPISSGRVDIGDVPAYFTLNPHGGNVSSWPRPQYSFSREDLLNSTTEREKVEAGLAWVDAQRECHDRWNRVERQINDFLDTCKSLNEALKLLPDIERYVPEYYLSRVNEKRGGTASAKKTDEEARKAEVLAALKNVDVEVVRTSEVLARMAAGAGSST